MTSYFFLRSFNTSGKTLTVLRVKYTELNRVTQRATGATQSFTELHGTTQSYTGLYRANAQKVPHGYKNYIMVKQEILVFRNHFTKNKGLLWIFFSVSLALT